MVVVPMISVCWRLHRRRQEPEGPNEQNLRLFRQNTYLWNKKHLLTWLWMPHLALYLDFICCHGVLSKPSLPSLLIPFGIFLAIHVFRPKIC